MYTNSNESGRSLLNAAQPIGTTTDEDIGREQQYGMDRWRTGGSGYLGVPGQEPDQGMEYDYYRGRRGA